MNNRYRPFDLAKDIINEAGLDISYLYDDLIFSDHSIFILQFDDKNPDLLKLYFNRECNLDNMLEIKNKLYAASEPRGMRMQDEGKFYLTENLENQEISIHYE